MRHNTYNLLGFYSQLQRHRFIQAQSSMKAKYSETPEQIVCTVQ
jgi:hypothetical protein